MTFATRFVSLIGVASCAVMLAACGELFSARTQAADGSPASDANAGTVAPSDGNNASSGNAPTGNANTPTVNNGNTNMPTSNNGNSTTPTPSTTTPTTTTPDAATSLAVMNNCAQKSAGYVTDAKAVLATSCATSGCHVSGGISPNLSTATAAQSGLKNGGLDRIVSGSMPTGGKTITSAGKCIVYNWADYGYLP